MTDPDPLRDELRELADTVAPADLYERSLARSHRLGRREVAVGTTAAVLALALLGSGLWQLPRSGPSPVADVAAPPPVSSAPVRESPAAAPAQSRTAAPPRPGRPRPPATTSAPRSTSIADLPGQVFYASLQKKNQLLRLTPGSTPVTVLSQPYETVGVSPDGSRVSYVSDGRLMVVDTAGGEAQAVYSGTASAAQAPVWSADGGQLLIDAAEPGVLDVATGAVTPLPSGLGGQRFRWSGDGSTLVYATGGCGLGVADATAQSGAPVPETEDLDGHPTCRPVSVDATGDLVAVRLGKTAEDTDSAAAPADAVLDTVTGDIVDLPVSGNIIGAVFDPAGNLLVRSFKNGERTLTLFAPDFTLLLRAREPAELRSLALVAYTR